MQDRFDGSRPATSHNLPDERTLLDVDRLDVYRVAIEFQRLGALLRFPRTLGHLRNQLDRASASVALNIAEGVGRRGAGDRAHFYAIARGSAMECVAIVDIARSRGIATAEASAVARSLLLRIVQMLTRLSQR